MKINDFFPTPRISNELNHIRVKDTREEKKTRRDNGEKEAKRYITKWNLPKLS